MNITYWLWKRKEVITNKYYTETTEVEIEDNEISWIIDSDEIEVEILYDNN